jgi:hypothetical protein
MHKRGHQSSFFAGFFFPHCAAADLIRRECQAFFSPRFRLDLSPVPIGNSALFEKMAFIRC